MESIARIVLGLLHIIPPFAEITSKAANKSVRRLRYAYRDIPAGTPILFSDSVGNEIDIIPGTAGTTSHGLHFEFYMTGMSLFSEQQTRGVYAVELPFKSGVHLIGIPVKNETPVAIHHTKGLERVELEGTYNHVFHLYSERDDQVQSRYVMDPSAMVFTVDFCSNFNWEILGDTLYFMGTESFPTFDLVDQFVEHIRPAVEVPSDRRKNPYKMSYTHLHGRIFLCPICQKQLVAGHAWLACPDGHGCLVTGKQMIEMKAETKPAPEDTGKPMDHNNLTCPYCQNPMHPTRYQHTRTIIDVCSKCMFRWLDAHEPTALFK